MIAVVVNPSSGRGKGSRVAAKVDGLLRSMDVAYRMEASQSSEDAERLAQRAAAGGAEVVAALGGDGHVGACANGLLGGGAALAVIPAGTGNDFARHLGLDRKDPLAATALLSSPLTRPLDAVQVKTPEQARHYVNVGGAGFDSDVNEHANGVRRLNGTLKYVYSTFVTLARFKPGDFTVTVDGEQHDFRGMMLAVGNGSSYGGGMQVCPGARSDDGVLEVCVIQELSKGQFVAAFPKVFKGRHVGHPAVRMLRGRDIEISSGRSFQVYADGERVGSLPASFTIVPGALRVVVPPEKASP